MKHIVLTRSRRIIMILILILILVRIRKGKTHCRSSDLEKYRMTSRREMPQIPRVERIEEGQCTMLWKRDQPLSGLWAIPNRAEVWKLDVR